MWKCRGCSTQCRLTLNTIAVLLLSIPPFEFSEIVSIESEGSQRFGLPWFLSDNSIKSSTIETMRQTKEAPIDPHMPSNPSVYPTSFGAFNVSWDPPISDSLLSQYEVVLRNLTPVEDVRRRICPWYKTIASESGMMMRRWVRPWRNPWLYLTELLPDTFYSVAVSAHFHDGYRSAPVLLPSSPLVPAAPPSGHPSQISVSLLGGQSATISWSVPNDIECNGKLMGFIMEVNSTYETSQLITIIPEASNHNLTELMPGTDYTLRMAVSTRGGQGRWSPPVLFRTEGETRVIDMEAFFTTLSPMLPPSSALLPHEGDFIDGNTQTDFLVPERIIDFRGQSLINAIHLSWTIKWRRYRDTGRSFEPHSHTNADEQEVVEIGNPLQVAPNVMFRLTWRAADIEDAEDIISAAYTSYTLSNLRAGIPYYFLLIVIIPGEDGPSAYTVATPKPQNKDTPETSKNVPIPMNLLVHQITPTEVTLQWELPQDLPKSYYRGVLGYQVRYYPVRRSESDQSTSPMVVNITNPEAISVVLRHLQPETVYEFAVRVVSSSNGDLESDYPWSMVQGFETLGKRPESPPQNITVSSVMTGYRAHPKPILGGASSNNGSSSSGNGASILVNWQGVAALGARGFYHLYLASTDQFDSPQPHEWGGQQQTERRRPKWSRQVVPNGQNSTVVHNLRFSKPYFLVMSAQNRFGRSPLSSLYFFRTADADGSGFINLNMPGRSYEIDKMTPSRIQQLSEELELFLKTLKSSDAAEPPTFAQGGDSLERRQSQWVLIAAILAVIVVIIVTLAVTIALTRRFMHSRLDKVRKECINEATRQLSEKSTMNSPMSMCSHASHHSGMPSCCEARFAQQVGNLMHTVASVPPVNFEGSPDFNPYAKIPFMMRSGAGASGGCSVASGSMHSQPVFVHALAHHNSGSGVGGRGGSESDARITPVDSDLESAKSANLVTAFPYHAYHQPPPHHTTLATPTRHCGGTASPPIVAASATERQLTIGHAGIVGSLGMQESNSESRRGGGCYHNYHLHQPVPLPPKMENLFPSPNKSPGRPLLLPYRELGRLEVAGAVGALGNSESVEASRSTTGSSGYDSGAPTNQQPTSVNDRALTESFIARLQPQLDTHPGISDTLPTSSAENEPSGSDNACYQNQASIKLNSYSEALLIPRIRDLDERNISKVYSTEELTEEMANLEGLMKNLTAITQKDFDCTSEL